MPAMILKTTWTVNIAQYTATNLRRLVMAPIKLGNKSEAGEVEPMTIAATQRRTRRRRGLQGGDR